MKFQDIYHFFQTPPPIQLGKEVAVCYVLAVLLEKGDFYGTALIQYLEIEFPMYRLSDTVLYNALKFLENEDVIDSYWQKLESKGRPRKMYHIKVGKIELAKQFGRLWHQYLAQNETNARQQFS